MTGGSIARRYAKALIDIGVESGEWERLGDEVGSLARSVAGSAELAQLLTNPAFPRSERERVMLAVLDRLRSSQTTVNFARLLLERERIGALSDIARELAAMIDARAGRVAAEVRSAVALDESQRQRLAQALETASGKKVQMTLETDPSLLGGVVAKVGDKLYDGSLRTQLERIRQTLAG